MDEVNCYDGSTENAQATPSIRSDEANPSAAATTEQQPLVNAHVPVPVPVLPSINDLPIVTLPAAAEVATATATATAAADGLLDDVHAQKRRSVSHKYSLQNEKQWLDKLDELKKYCTEHGNCLVPQKYPLNPQLGTWVHKQRTQYANWKRDKPSQITTVRVKLLEEAGMDWSTVSVMQPKEEGWQAMYEKLVAFQQANGHCLVPKRYKPDSQLGEWVCNQRKHYGFLKKGKKTAMTVERIKALEEIGFVWDASSKCANQRDEARWLFMLEELKKYQTEKGDCLVPTKYAANPKLGNWVSNERRHYKLMLDKRPTSMTEERKRKLEEVGFSWLAPGSNYARHSSTTTTTSSSSKVVVDPTNNHPAKRICTTPNNTATDAAAAVSSTSNSHSVAILEQHGIHMDVTLSAANQAMAEAVHASTATAAAASVHTQAHTHVNPLSMVNNMTEEEHHAVQQALGQLDDDEAITTAAVDDGIAMAAIVDPSNVVTNVPNPVMTMVAYPQAQQVHVAQDPPVLIAKNHNNNNHNKEAVDEQNTNNNNNSNNNNDDDNNNEEDELQHCHEPVAVSAMQMQATSAVDGTCNSSNTGTSVAGVVAAIQLQATTHSSLDDDATAVPNDAHTTTVATSSTAEETAASNLVPTVNMDDEAQAQQQQPVVVEQEVSVEEVAARVAEAAASASKAAADTTTTTHDGGSGSGGGDGKEEECNKDDDDAPLSLWVCKSCGKTTFLKLANCCEQNMVESVVQNI
mmetsp:Transcript_27279/g.42376  ORF Transcript_27279/g.42376 Transcript_27279/m.42376 type:complete len:746 (-) Transcript_27279:281-2518(-)|eukprot:CAMPEP_0196809564 /NCGR_PEP_ID=MMETSP1362-20130617/9476_1 /TAXON_ID=163516 /ORGANISM="Leptocylindrus danicus, Strain CCMP1856" /LENGTH=745 /DNA_ID=CAMNT_0042184291 /DNA_START=327 /DNA_END=2564 /DNA_ORIENTATION=+